LSLEDPDIGTSNHGFVDRGWHCVKGLARFVQRRGPLGNEKLPSIDRSLYDNAK